MTWDDDEVDDEGGKEKLPCPRDAQRDFDKQAEKQKADLDGDDVILCHTERGLR